MENLDEKIFRFIYITAMRDAVIQKSYQGKKKWLEESDVLEILKDKVIIFINKVLDNEYLSQEDYDADFLNVAISICEIINKKANNNEFTFGNSQKLINIMLKYFYITSYGNDHLKENFKFCHCPMDQRLLEKVWDDCKSLNCDMDLGKHSDFTQSWGNEDFKCDNAKKTFPKRYDLFQKAVHYIANKKGINPLEYDYCNW